MKFQKRILFITLFLISFQLSAGWLITGRYIDREGNTILKRYFIQDNQIKVEQFNLIYSCNLKTGSIILVDPEKLVFVKTNLASYTSKLKELKMSRLQELLALIPDDQKPEYEKKYREQVENALILPSYRSDTLILKQLADTAKLLNHKTFKYLFTENGRKKEEFFFTNEVNISSDLDMNTFLSYMYLLEPEDKTILYRASGTYSELVKNGLVLRRFIFEDGFRTEWQVNKIEEKNIPVYEFGIPALCKELTLDNWLSRKKDSDDKFYDDYE